MPSLTYPPESDVNNCDSSCVGGNILLKEVCSLKAVTGVSETGDQVLLEASHSPDFERGVCKGGRVEIVSYWGVMASLTVSVLPADSVMSKISSL